MRRTITVLTATGLVATLALVQPLGAAPEGTDPAPGAPPASSPLDEPLAHPCGNADGTVTFDGAPVLWPPNHKYQTLTIQAIADDAEAAVSLETAGSHDEVADDTGEELEGAGATDRDIDPEAAEASDEAGSPNDADGDGEGVATASHGIRAERSGLGDGRTYTIEILASFDGTPCEVDEDPGSGEEAPAPVTFTVEVPHDVRDAA